MQTVSPCSGESPTGTSLRSNVKPAAPLVADILSLPITPYMNTVKEL